MDDNLLPVKKYIRILEKFENLLDEYYQTAKSLTHGLPSVAYCASELNLSPGYFGDLVKKETGKTAQEYTVESDRRSERKNI